LTGYQHTASKSKRFFCSKCGCHIGDVGLDGDQTDNGQWTVATSVFTEHGSDVFQIHSHTFTESAPGGGLYQWLTTIGDREMRIWNPGPGDENSPQLALGIPKQEFDEDGKERLRAECHCGGVSFNIPRPTLPDTTDDPYIKKYVSPLDKNKWIAALDVCDDCRLMDGTHVVAWTFVPLAQLRPRVPPDFRFGTLKTFESSKGVLRAFCGTCGATVFYSSDQRKPDEARQIVDVSVGIIRAPEGVTADEWFSWRTGRIAFADSGKRYDSEFFESLRRGYDAWGRNMYGESPSFMRDT
jgi:hypothetical protein